MKKTILITALISLFCGALIAQEPEFEYYKNRDIKTLLGHDSEGGFYGAFTGGYTVIDHRNAVSFGGRIGWFASHSIGVGFGAAGFMNEFHFDPMLERDVAIAGGYGGLYIEPVLLPRFPVHLSFPVLFGAGGISTISRDNTWNHNMIDNSQAFLLIEPGAEIELNLTRFCRFAIGGTYRFPTTFDLGLSGTPVATAQSIRGFSYTVSLKFGKF